MRTESFNSAIAAIESEREYQDRLWGPTNSGGQHSTVEFLVYIRDYVETALHDASQHSDAQLKNTLGHAMRKITTLGVACMEQNGSVNRDLSDLSSACVRHDLDVEPPECNE